MNTQKAPFDMTKMLEKLDNSPDILNVVIEQFKNNITALLPVLEEAISEKDLGRIKTTAHKMKGLLDYFGNEKLTNGFLKLMEIGQLSEKDDPLPIFNFIQKEIISIDKYLDKGDWKKLLPVVKTDSIKIKTLSSI